MAPVTLDAEKDTLLDGYGEYPRGTCVRLARGCFGRLVIGLWIVDRGVYSAAVDIPGIDFTMDAAEGGVSKDGVDMDGLGKDGVDTDGLGKNALNEKLIRS